MTQEPQSPIFLSAEWRWLLMANYEVAPGILRPYLPQGTELDLWNGRCYISLVAFMFENTKVLGVKIPFHVNFEEVNLRFYVRRKGPEGWRRGVVFIKELVPKWAIATVARLVYNENYASVPMQHQITPPAPAHNDSPHVCYKWQHQKQSYRAEVQTVGQARPLIEDGEEAFITEHYWGYAKQRDGSTVEYQVMHPPWRVWQVNDYHIQGDFGFLYGNEFRQSMNVEPASIFLAEGSAITVHKGIKI
ncbi:MAG: DUF2071 domain-containing protein [Chloroflexota bacterium]